MSAAAPAVLGRRVRVARSTPLLTLCFVFLGAVLYIVMTKEDKPGEGETRAVRVASSNLITNEGTSEPKAVLSLYEDFLCPACGNFERQFGPNLGQVSPFQPNVSPNAMTMLPSR